MPGINVKEKLKNGELDLSSSGLKEIPYSSFINNAKQITSLNLSNNKITSVGKGIAQLTQLTKLDLSRNQLKGISDGISSLHRLEVLNLSQNNLVSLPNSINNLKSLKYLDLKANPLSQKYAKLAVSGKEGPQQTARNFLKNLSSQNSNTENDKNKKKEKEQTGNENKNKKNTDEKNPPNGVNQLKQKAKAKSKKTKKSVLQRVASYIFQFLQYSFLLILLLSISLYTISFLNEPLFEKIKSGIVPVWNKALTAYLGEEYAARINDGTVWLGKKLNSIIIFSVQFTVEAGRKTYVYLTTDKTIQAYLSSAKLALHNSWIKLVQTFQNLLGQQSATTTK